MAALDARAKEMEAASVAWVCETLQVPFVALKTITDLADAHATAADQFLENLHTASAQLTEHLMLFVDRVAGRALEDLD